jgi:hypothetical protein
MIGAFHFLHSTLSLMGGSKEVTLIGTHHFRDPKHVVRPALEASLSNNSSSVYLIETFANLAPHATNEARQKCLDLINSWDEDEGLRAAGESVLVVKHALAIGAEVWCAEPKLCDTHAELLLQHPIEFLWVDYVANRFPLWKLPELANPREEILDEIAQIADWFASTLPGGKGFNTEVALQMFLETAERILDKPCWAATEDEAFRVLITPDISAHESENALARLIADQVLYREKNIVKLVVEHLEKTNTVTLVYGASHSTSLIKLLGLEFHEKL